MAEPRVLLNGAGEAGDAVPLSPYRSQSRPKLTTDVLQYAPHSFVQAAALSPSGVQHVVPQSGKCGEQQSAADHWPY